MKVTTETLPAQLDRGLPAICLVAGDEPLLVSEACDAIRAKARAAGFTERELHVVERGFDWEAMRANSRNMSLFADRKIIEIRLGSAGPGEQGTKVLGEFAQEPNGDTLVLVIAGKLDSKSLSTRWVSSIEKNGWLIQTWPIELPRLPAWIRERLKRHGLDVDQAAAMMIAERVEGNLLAAHQEIEKLALLYPAGKLSLEAVENAVVDSARYDVLQLGLAAMQAQTARAMRILQGLREEGVDSTVVLWGLKQDITWLSRVAHSMKRGQSADSAMNGEYVWRPRQPAMKQALNRLQSNAIQRLLIDASNVDKAIKGVRRSDAWLELQALVARLAGVKLRRAA